MDKKKYFINDQYKRTQVFCACDERFNIDTLTTGGVAGKYADSEGNPKQCPKCRYYYWARRSQK